MTAVETDERIIPYNAAFNETLFELLRSDPDIFIAGEDVGRYGGVFQSFAGLNKEFGDERAAGDPLQHLSRPFMAAGPGVLHVSPRVR